MPKMEKRIRPVRRRRIPDNVDMGSIADYQPALQRIYAARGITSAEQLDNGLRYLLPISALEGVDQGVELLLAHKGKKILVIGDFDADGATSTALVLRCLRDFGYAHVEYLVPNRFEYGYGLTPEIVQVARQRNPDLLITVDNGVSSNAGVALANKLGIRVLVTDHHLPGPELPAAAVMINPNLPTSQFSSKHLAGVGVAFYLMAALGRKLQDQGLENAARIPARYLDLVALGTVADVVSLDQNNRILVTQGLDRIRSGKCVPGIAALLQIANKSLDRIVSTDLGFAVGPRLNAAGRLEDMSIGIECLLSDNAAEATRMAAMLDQINNDRREIEMRMRDEAFAYVDKMPKNNLPECICVYDASWHQGVVGLIASKVRERCDRPVIAFAEDQPGMLKGSGRSIPGVHIRDLLERIDTRNPGLIDKFGGHAMAAGLSLPTANYPTFAKAAALELVHLYPDADFTGTLLTDGALLAESLTLGFANELRAAGPWGAGFPEPVFSGDFKVVEQRVVGERHLKMRVESLQGGAPLDAIAFNQADESVAYRGPVQLVYRLDVNEFRGRQTAQLIVEQIASIAC